MKNFILLLFFWIFPYVHHAQPHIETYTDSVEAVSELKHPAHENDRIVLRNQRPFALIAGGSKGIGYAIAEALARKGYNLLLIARHTNALEESRKKLERTYNIQVEIMSQDLSEKDAVNKIEAWCNNGNIPLKVLANVAGFGGERDYLKLPLDSLRYMCDLNVESAMALCLKLLPLLERNAPSHIMNVASMAAFSPIPSKNMYSASKSALLYFSYSLRYQLKKKKISVSCLCPGPVFTKPEIKAQTIKQLGAFGKAMAVSPARVGKIAVRKTLRKRMIIVPGGLAHTMSVVIRMLPKRWGAAVYAKLEKQ